MSYTKLTIISLVLLFFLLPKFTFGAHIKQDKQTHDYPRLANYYLAWKLDKKQAKKLSRWDVVVLDMEHQMHNPELIKQMRQWNEDIIILAYITPQEIDKSALDLPQAAPLRNKLASGLASEWYLTDDEDDRLSWWPGTNMLNVAESAPKVEGGNLNDYIPRFVVNEVLSSGLWDGVFYDNAWDNVTYFVGNQVDIDNDGKEENRREVDKKWREGMKEIYRNTKNLTDDHIILLGNNHTKKYTKNLNGMMIENFSKDEWSKVMNRYRHNSKKREDPQINIINSNTNNEGGKQHYKKMRFGLASTLLEKGYYSFDYGDEDHSQLWWYDEYNIGLGQPTSDSESVSDKNKYQRGVWKREFKNGLAVANSTKQNQSINLNGRYEHINGASPVNDGSIKSKLKLKKHGGRVVLKTFDTLKGVSFTNGNFARFFNRSGERVRNGFFVFEDQYSGGDQIAHFNLDNKQAKEKVLLHNNHLEIWRNDGVKYFSKHPYGANFSGEYSLAFADLNSKDSKEVIVAPKSNHAKPIKIYNIYGKLLKKWYPLGSNYDNGYSIAAHNQQIRLATLEGEKGKILNYKTQTTFFAKKIYKIKETTSYTAYDVQSNHPSIALGNINRDNQLETVVGTGEGSDPTVKIFQDQKKIREFKPFNSFAKPGVEVKTKDVDFDGVEDIITLNKSINF
jgi:hypothetical protein